MKKTNHELIPLSEYCTNIRLESHLSAREFANQRGVSFAYIYRVEAGNMDKPSIAVLAKVMRVYNLTKEDLRKTTVERSFIDDADVFTSILHPFSNKKEISLKNQLEKITRKDIGAPELKNYMWDKFESRIFNFDRMPIEYDNKHNRIRYIYDAKGIDKDGNVCFLNVFDSSQRLYKDKGYIPYIVHMAKIIEGSIYAGIIDDNELKDKKINIIFATSSTRGYDLAMKYLDFNPISIPNSKTIIYKNVIYFDNRKGEKITTKNLSK